METFQSQEALMEKIIAAQVRKWELNARKKYKRPIRPVITISRLPGSGANTLARQLSEDLKIDLFDNEIAEAVAKSARVSESVIATLDEQDRSILDDWIGALDRDRHLWPDEYIAHLTKVVGAIAAHGHAVIVGRGAGYILPQEVCLRVLLVAPMDVRISNVVYAYKVTRGEAEKRILKTEGERAQGLYQEVFPRRPDGSDPLRSDLEYVPFHRRGRRGNHPGSVQFAALVRLFHQETLSRMER